MNKVLMLHQGSELYGSDRSFLSIAIYVAKKNNIKTKIILPYEGDLSNSMRKSGLNPYFHSLGILRKKDVKKPLSFLLGLVRSIKFYFMEFKTADIVYINTVVMVSAILASVFYRRKKIICHIREIPSKYQIWLFKLILKISGIELVFNSHATKNAFKLKGTVIYNGVKPVLASNSSEFTSTLGTKTKFLVIGRINNWKGQDIFLEALSKLDSTIKKLVTVRIVGGTFEGDNSYLTRLHDFVQEEKLSDLVSFYDFSDNPSEHYNWANWIVVPSKKPEPFGRIAIESFAHGRPVIAANHGGLPEIITDKLNGYLIPPNSAQALARIIELCTKNKDEFDAFCHNAHAEFLARFSESTYQINLYKVISGEKA